MSAQTAFLLFLVLVVLAVAASRLRPAPNPADSAITAELNQALTKDYSFHNTQIDVKTFDGVVILGGFVRESEQMRKAVDMAKAIGGVKSVDNRLAIRSGG